MAKLRLHERYKIVTQAADYINSAVTLTCSQFDLTDVEILQILTDRQSNILKYMLRSERHPENPSKRADEK